MAPDPKDSQVSVRLPADLKARVETYAELTGRTKSHVAMEALKEYLVWREPQIADLKEAVAAADRGEFANDAEVAEVFARYAPQAQRRTATKGRGPRQK